MFCRAGKHMSAPKSAKVSKISRRRKRASAGATGAHKGDGACAGKPACEALLKSPVVIRLPRDLRSRLDRAVIERAVTGASLESIARDLDLSRHGVSLAAVRRYAAVLEEVLRPVASAQVIAGVLKCLPSRARRDILAGNQLLLLSKVACALSEASASDLPAGELVKLAGVLRSAAQGRSRTRRGKAAKGGGEDLLDPTQMGPALRMLYGLSWPFPEGTTADPEKSKAPVARG